MIRTSVLVQWLQLCLPVCWSAGSIPGWGAKIPHPLWPKNQKKKKKK